MTFFCVSDNTEEVGCLTISAAEVLLLAVLYNNKTRQEEKVESIQNNCAEKRTEPEDIRFVD